MIRFSAFLVVVAVGLLIAGVVTSKLVLVYIAIGVSGVALLALGIGAAVNWRELTSKPMTAAADTATPAPVVPAAAAPAVASASAAQSPAHPQAAVRAATGVAATGSGRPAAVPATPPSRAGYLPTEQPQKAQPTTRPASPAADPFPPAAQPQPTARPQPTAAQAPAAYTPRREPPARDVWEWRDDSTQAPPSSRTQAPPRPAAAFVIPDTSKLQPPSQPRVIPSPGASSVAVQPLSDAAASPPSKQQEHAKVPEQAEVPEHAEEPEGALEPERAKQAEEPEPAGLDPNMEVTVVPGVPRYHNAGCILIRFMDKDDLGKMTRAAAREAGCTPCRACLPDQPDKSPE